MILKFSSLTIMYLATSVAYLPALYDIFTTSGSSS